MSFYTSPFRMVDRLLALIDLLRLVSSHSFVVLVIVPSSSSTIFLFYYHQAKKGRPESCVKFVCQRKRMHGHMGRQPCSLTTNFTTKNPFCNLYVGDRCSLDDKRLKMLTFSIR